MTLRSIRFRLTAWYSAVLALALILFGLFSWIAIREILFHSVDEVLADRVAGVKQFMDNQIGALSVEEIRDEFKEHSVLGPGGDLFQVCDAQGTWLYRSASLENDAVSIQTPDSLPTSDLLEDRIVNGTPLRFLSRGVPVLGKRYTIQIAAPTREIHAGLITFRWILLLMIPFALAAAAGGGWWISGRALRPVDAVTSAARSIGEQSLGHRLPVPRTNDELERLSETLNQMLDRIESAFRRVTQFTADASHELRTPIAFIRTSAEIALRKPRSEADYRQSLSDVLSESVRTTDLIENLLTLARADAGKATLERVPVDLNSMIQETAGQAAKLARQKGVTITVESATDPLPFKGDRSSLRRLVLILLDNAVKFTPSGGAVVVALTASKTTVDVVVRDNGIGIAAGDLPHIFERFYRSDRSRSRDSGGAGLGLSLAQWIVEVHGGQIHVESQLDQGSRFQVTLPRAGQ